MKVALGVTGGIAAYKAAEIARLLQEHGIRVQVIMTRAAQEFIRPLTFASLTGEKVITDFFAHDGDSHSDHGETPVQANGEPNLESAVEHIAVAQSIDLLLVAPATADIIAKFANGFADDFLSTTFLATKAPVVVAPAMNVNMWANASTRSNVAKLLERGVKIVAPDAGYLACGMTGPGRLAANQEIVKAVLEALAMGSDLAGETVLITAGPTHEPVDPVRFIGNRSSGKMGYQLAKAAQRRGARVILVSGPTALASPDNIEVTRVQTAAEMQSAVMSRLAETTIVIKAAAVADFQPRKMAPQKIKRSGALILELEPTPDILAGIVGRRSGQIVFAFAAETENVLENARQKLRSKSLDGIVVNDVSQPDIGFDSERNAVTIITRDQVTEVPTASKFEVAQRVLDAVIRVRRASHDQVLPPHLTAGN